MAFGQLRAMFVQMVSMPVWVCGAKPALVEHSVQATRKEVCCCRPESLESALASLASY